MIQAPWTQGQVNALNAYQLRNDRHPFTCANQGRQDHAVSALAGQHTVLIATPEGWVCPACDYTQDWAHDFMAIHPAQDPNA